jgi:hypothetical protein
MTAGMSLYSFREADPALIEIVGRPGSGKSFLCQSLLDTPGWRAEPGAYDPGRRWLAPLTMIFRPIVSLLTLAAALTRGANARGYRQIIRVVRRYDGVRRIKGRGVTVVDEGPLHALMHIFFWSSSTIASRPITHSLMTALVRSPTIFICIDIGREAALNNARQRDEREAGINKETSQEVIERFLCDTSYEEIVGAIKSIAPEKVRCFSSVAEARDFLAHWPLSARGAQSVEPDLLPDRAVSAGPQMSRASARYL